MDSIDMVGIQSLKNLQCYLHPLASSISRSQRLHPSITMRILLIPRSIRNSMDVDLEHDDEVVDPRIIDILGMGYKCSFSVNGRTLTIMRIGRDEGWDGFCLRVYRRSTEATPDFMSTVYTYWGLDLEEAPRDTTKVIFHPSVTTIKSCAFSGCNSLVRVTIPDTVIRIERLAFFVCDSLKSIRLSTNLVYIGDHAFHNCKSLQAAFLPPTVTEIVDEAFINCKSLRFLHVPESIDNLGTNVVWGCDRLSTTPVSNNLSKVCSSTSVTPQMIPWN